MNLVLQKIVRDSQVNREGNLINKSDQIISSADDLALIARNLKELEDITRTIVEAACKMRLKVNENKSKIMRVGTHRTNNKFKVVIQFGELNFEEVKKFRYFIAFITNNCEEAKKFT